MNLYRDKDQAFMEFFKKRSSLIVQLEKNEISKKEFLECNYRLVMNMNSRPFLRIDSYEMGMYNYQYYNVLAKYFGMLAKEIKDNKRRQRYYRDYANKCNNYYHEKDKAALALLEFLEYKGVEAYYIEVNSKSLDNKLFEIVLLDYKEAIFHSKAPWFLEKLKENKVFLDKKKKSIIHEYINESY